MPGTSSAQELFRSAVITAGVLFGARQRENPSRELSNATNELFRAVIIAAGVLFVVAVIGQFLN